jgi:predicted transcriptional regulator
MICPLCGATNIEGADTCEECKNSLVDLHLQPPVTEIEKSLLKDRVSDLAPKSPIAVAPDACVKDVLDTLVKNVIGCVFVVENDEIVGVFTEQDALMRLSTNVDEFGNQPVSEVMTRQVRSLEADAKIAFAVRMMDQGGYRHAPVVTSDGGFEGVISARDILRYLHDKMASTTS